MLLSTALNLSDPQHRGSWPSEAHHEGTQAQLDHILQKFPVVGEYFQHEDDKRQADQTRGTLRANLQAAREFSERLQVELAAPVDADIGLSIFKAAKSSGRKLVPIVMELAPYLLLKEHGAKIIELAKADEKQAELAVREFEKKNGALLAEFDADVKAAQEKRLAEIQAEQDAAIAARNAKAETVPLENSPAMPQG